MTTTGALREACADYQLTSDSLLLVCATTRSESLTSAATKYGVARPSGSATEIVPRDVVGIGSASGQSQ